jgi:hypothetical protein
MNMHARCEKEDSYLRQLGQVNNEPQITSRDIPCGMESQSGANRNREKGFRRLQGHFSSQKFVDSEVNPWLTRRLMKGAADGPF